MQEELKSRLDLRDKCIVTVDPASCRDVDDALSVWPVENSPGLYRVGVHIADVSYFVKPGTPLDTEAYKRSSTVYLVDRAIHMLPRVLSESVCSLNEEVDRLAFSCLFTMNEQGEVIANEEKQRPWFGRTVIRSCAKLDYGNAQRIIDSSGAGTL